METCDFLNGDAEIREAFLFSAIAKDSNWSLNAKELRSEDGLENTISLMDSLKPTYSNLEKVEAGSKEISPMNKNSLNG